MGDWRRRARRAAGVALFVALEGAAVGLYVRSSTHQGGVWASAAGSAGGWLMERRARVERYARLGEENRAMARRIAVLERRLAAMREMLQEAGASQLEADSLALSAAASGEWTEAEVVAARLGRRDGLLAIDKGRADGVKEEMGVVGPAGVVGIVCQVSERRAVVLPVVNSRSSVSCRVRRTGYFGSLRWEGGSTAEAWLTDVPRHARVEVGMEVETSGFSAVFPAGVFVGRVTGVEESADGLTYRLRVGLATDFGRIGRVWVTDMPGREELDSLERAAERSFAGED